MTFGTRVRCLLLGGWLLAGGVPGVHAQSAPAADALDRDTPRDAMRGFLKATRDRDFALASQYLDLRRIPEAARAEQGPSLARQLKIVLDRTLWVELEALSDARSGKLDDGLPPSREAVGKIETERGPVTILMSRRTKGEEALIWRVSAATVERIPALYEEFGYGPLGHWLPDPFFEFRMLEIQLWQWIGLAVAVLLAWAVSFVIAWIVVRAVRPFVSGTATTFDDKLLEITAGPLRLLAAVGFFSLATLPLSLAVPAQRFFSTLEQLLAFVGFLWLVFRFVDVLSLWATERLEVTGQTAVRSMLPVGRRIVKVVLGGLAVIALLQNLGLNVTGLLAGLGVGGLAVALAAQRTVENLFGGVTVIADQPVRVGDFCRFGDRVGTIEDIGLRSTRVRTLDRTVVTIANAEFSQMQLENFAKRDRIWYHPRIGLRYETTPDQIRYVLIEIRRMLYAHPRVASDSARIRFAGFGASSLDLDIFAYVTATDYGEYLEIAEDLNLRIMDIVEQAGSSFAFPSQTLYVEQGEGLDAKKVEQAESEVKDWREQQQLYLPRFPLEEIERLASTLDYPPEGSPQRSEG